MSTSFSDRVKDAFSSAGINPTNPDNKAVAPTEDAIASAFAEHNAGRRVYDHTQGCWFVWNGRRWTRDLRNCTFHAAREFTRAINDGLLKAQRPLTRIA